MYARSSLFVSTCILLLISLSIMAFVTPYVAHDVHTPLDDILPISRPYTLTFATETTEEQWQIEPLASMLSVLYIPNDIYIASPSSADERLFMITRRIKTPDALRDVREFYARTSTGDYLLGRVTAGRIIPYRTRILIRPQQANPPAWHHFFTDGDGSIRGEQTRDAQGCRVIHIAGRDMTAWQETLCPTQIRSQNHDATTQTDVPRTATAVLSTREVLATQTPPSLAQLTTAQLTRLGTFQLHNNNEKIIAPLVVLQPHNLLIGAITSGYLVAMHIEDGAIAWSYRVAGDIYGAPVRDTFHGDIVLATTHKEVHTVSAQGIRRWSTTLSDPIVADPCVTDAGVIVADTAGNVTLLDAFDGRVRWTYNVGSNIVATPAYAPSHDLVIVASQSGALTALTLTGELAWQSDNHEAVLADLRIADELVYTIGNSGSVAAYATATGNRLWLTADNAQTEWPVTVANNVIAVASAYDTRLYDTTGHLLLRVEGEVVAPPFLIDGAVILVDQTAIRMHDMQGRVLQTWALNSMVNAHDSSLQQLQITFAPQYDSNGLYLADSNGRVIALSTSASATTLQPRWYHNVSIAPLNTQTIVQTTVDPNGNLVVASSTQDVIVLAPQSGEIMQRVQGFAALPPHAIASTNDMVFIADRIHVAAYTRTDGREQWKVPATAIDTQQLLLSGNYLIHLYQTNAVQAVISVIEQATGTIVWSQPYFSTADQSRVYVDDEAVYVNGLFSLAIRDGAVRWLSELPLAQQVPTKSKWCGVITIQPDAYGCVDRFTGKTSAASVAPLPRYARLFANATTDLFVVATPTHLWVKDSRTNTSLWDAAQHTPIQEIVIDDTQRIFVTYTDGRITVYGGTTGDVIAVLRDAPIAYESNSHYGALIPLRVSTDGLFLISNLHILGFTNDRFSGGNP